MNSSDLRSLDVNSWPRVAARSSGLRRRGLAASLLSLGVAAMALPLPAGAAEALARTPQEAATAFYGALNRMFRGDVAAMEHVWSHGDDVTYMGPGGDYLVGWKQIWPVWQQQGAMKLGGRVDPRHSRFTAGKDLAVMSTVEVGQNVVKGKPQQVVIRVTNVFRKEGSAWKMIGHHTDLLPYIPH